MWGWWPIHRTEAAELRYDGAAASELRRDGEAMTLNCDGAAAQVLEEADNTGGACVVEFVVDNRIDALMFTSSVDVNTGFGPAPLGGPPAVGNVSAST